MVHHNGILDCIAWIDRQTVIFLDNTANPKEIVETIRKKPKTNEPINSTIPIGIYCVIII